MTGAPRSLVPDDAVLVLFGATGDLARRKEVTDEAWAMFSAKKPGPQLALEPASLSFRYADSFNAANGLEAYERLVHDVMLGDSTLFNDAAGIERLWEVAAPLLSSPPAPLPYGQGSWGPERAGDLVAPHRWHLPDCED